MKFEEAFKHLLDGAKIRNADWIDGHFIFLDEEEGLVDEDKDMVDFNDHFNSDDWEIYKDPKVLVLHGTRFVRRLATNTYLVPYYFETREQFLQEYPEHTWHRIGPWKRVEVKLES